MMPIWTAWKRTKKKMIDALAKALELAETAEGADKWESEQAIAAVAASYAAIAQAAAAERQAAAMERIADALVMDNDLTLIDALYTLIETISNRP
jgi:hypothetical protein